MKFTNLFYYFSPVKARASYNFTNLLTPKDYLFIYYLFYFILREINLALFIKVLYRNLLLSFYSKIKLKMSKGRIFIGNTKFCKSYCKVADTNKTKTTAIPILIKTNYFK